jgi:hypothetical protein
MAWPDSLNSISTNMDQSELTIIKFALDHELVEWGESSLFISLGMADFIFNGHAYSLEESFEVITTINRKE